MASDENDREDDAARARENRQDAASGDRQTHHGSAEPSGVDSEPEGTQSEEDTSAAPPSAAHGA